MPHNEPVINWNFGAIAKVALALIMTAFNLLIFGFWLRHIVLHPAKFPVNYFYLAPFFVAALYVFGEYIVLIRNPKGKFWPTDTFNLLLIALSWSSPIDSKDFKIISGLVAISVLFFFFADRMLKQMEVLKAGDRP